MRLVPHVYRQEMMLQDSFEYHHETKGVSMVVELDSNESPINLFNIDYESYPQAKHIGR